MEIKRALNVSRGHFGLFALVSACTCWLLVGVGCAEMRAVRSTTGPEAPKPPAPAGPITAGQLPRDGFFNAETLAASSIDRVAAQVRAGGVLILSEEHGNPKHYERQKLALTALSNTRRCTVSVGLEFLAWNHQDAISKYLDETIDEVDFLSAVEWGGNPFTDYRDQALFPKSTGGELLGINALRSLTGAISKRGLSNLTADELLLMPPNFQLGSTGYRERFDIIMGGHVSADAVDRYFAAQSTWDDTMAWQAAEFLKSHPSHCLAIIVGDFHAAWGGGLKERLTARGVSNVTVVSQFETRHLTEEELTRELGPHPKYGARADAVWLSQSAPGAASTSRSKALNFFQ